MKKGKPFRIVKRKEGVYYVDNDIIFAKAGDVFFMPRKLPPDFETEPGDLPTRANAKQIEVMSEDF